MDIICKDCGHTINDHLPDGCFHCENGTTSVNNTCLCDRIPSDVATMFFTEQQARLDTLTAENEKLFEVNSRTWCAYCQKQYPRTDDAMQQIREHISTCEKHPMRQVEAERDALKDALEKALEFFECANFDFRNGNECNGIDEGEVLAVRYLTDSLFPMIKSALRMDTNG